ncbi:MAG: integrase core domain-containing protein [Candidatus Roizmanbacteria bacterium]
MNKLSQIALAWELYENNTPIVTISQILKVHRETIGIWIIRTKKNPNGIMGFLDQYINAKKGERKKRRLDGLLKARIYRIRDENKECCGQKIKEYVIREFGTSPSVATIYRALKEKYQLRSKWKRNQKRGPVPRADYPRQVIQMDSVDFGNIFAFTGIDIYSKEVVVKLYQSLTSHDGEDFLTHAFKTRFNHVELLQTDGGSEFKDNFKRKVYLYADRFRISRPYRKNEQAFIESFNRTLRKECLGWSKYPKKELPILEKELNEYLVYYHEKRVHLSLNMKTPNEVIKSYQLMSDI